MDRIYRMASSKRSKNQEVKLEKELYHKK